MHRRIAERAHSTRSLEFLRLPRRSCSSIRCVLSWISVDAHSQTVESRRDSPRKLSLEVGAGVVMGPLSGGGALGADIFRDLHSFRNAQMSRMARPEKRIDHEDARAFENS